MKKRTLIMIPTEATDQELDQIAKGIKLLTDDQLHVLSCHPFHTAADVIDTINEILLRAANDG